MSDIAFVASSGKLRSASGATFTTASFGTNPTSGHLMVVSVFITSTTSGARLGTGSVTDNQGNTYTQAVASPARSGGSWGTLQQAAIYYLVLPASYSGYTITIAPTGSPGSNTVIVCVGVEYSGQNATPLDVTASNSANASVGASVGPTATTAADCQLAVGCVSISGTGTWDAITNWTDRCNETDSGTYTAGDVKDQIQATSLESTTVSLTWTLNTGSAVSGSNTECVATFRAAAAATVTTDVTTTAAASTTDTADATTTAATTTTDTKSVTTDADVTTGVTTDVTTTAATTTTDTKDVTTTAVAKAPASAEVTSDAAVQRFITSNVDLTTAANVRVLHDVPTQAAVQARVTADLTSDASVVVPRLSVTTDAAVAVSLSVDVTTTAAVIKPAGGARSFAPFIG